VQISSVNFERWKGEGETIALLAKNSLVGAKVLVEKTMVVALVVV
jgi:hypothetical protein